ncbi:MAG TPA: histidine kinase, partial [Xanthobacteraceae bacterium]
HEDETHYCVMVADDGVGLPEGISWPVRGKLAALILQTLRENAEVNFEVETAPGKGTRMTIEFVHEPVAHKPN